MMLPKDKKLCIANLPPDVLSNLPENVLDEILIRVPLRDAVRTSMLSKKWRYNWCRLPEFVLDQTLWDTTNESIPFVTRFTDIIYHLLVLHVGPITKFILSDIANLGNYSKIDSLLLLLSRNGIQHLVLQFPKNKPYKLPSSFFSCLQMRHLSLHYCSIQLLSTFKGFSELVSLELCEVTVSSEMLASLISHILLLEKLVLRISSILNYIQIDAPKLKSFDFTGNINILSLGKTPFLVKLSLVNTAAALKAGKHISKYFEFCPALEHLHLDYSSLQIEYSALNELLLPVPDNVVNEITSSFSDVTLDHLRSVKLEGITGTKTEIEFIKLLLSKSPVLVRMLIQQKIANVSAETRLKVVTEIT
ncbi:hypothetical protein EJD97_014583, partial [Solanum chilense]